jgi:FAD/FMN-containing dehydrogenase
MISTTDTAVDELRRALGGALHLPGEPKYAEACTLFNAMIERRPALVARCASPDDVIGALAFARDHGLPIAVRAGGHSVAGVSLVDDGLVIDVRPMDDVVVDPQRRIARVGAGATWGRLDRAAHAHGMATTGGRVSTTGVAGLTLGGGSGWLERKLGLACDNLVAAELVTVDGERVRASETENPDLLWALRGGGGNFGVVTSLELALHPLPSEVLAGLALWPVERGRELLALYRDVVAQAPDEFGAAFGYITAPPEPFVPSHLQGKVVVGIAGMHAGTVSEGEEALSELRAFGPPEVDLFGPMAYPDLQCMIDDPPGNRNYWTDEHLGDLPDAAIEAIARRGEEMPPGPAQLLVVGWGGAVAPASEADSPLAGRDAAFVVHPFALWPDARDDARMISWARAFRDDLRPFATGGVYLNFVGDEGDARVRAAYGPRNYERLARIKAEWDPENVLRATGNVPPARG